ITPWATLRLIKRDSDLHHEAESWTTRVYRKVMRPLIYRPFIRWTFLFSTLGLLLFALAFLPLKWTTVKMLPFDNKSEFQIIVDMDEGTTLEETARVIREIADYLATVPEVTDYQLYIGTAAPFNFNGLVRHYYLRRGSNVADIQVNLLPKHERDAQSHDIAKHVRPAIQKIAAKYGARVKIAEVPPGPPVLQTLVAEVYGPDYEGQRKVAQRILNLFRTTEGVVDADWYMEADRWEWRFVVDKEKAALHGVNTEHVTNAIALALNGMKTGLAHQPHEKEDMVIFVRFPRPERSSIDALKDIKVMSAYGKLIPLSELVRVEKRLSPKSIYHKNLLPVVYVTADVAGREESPVYSILKLNKRLRQDLKLPSDEQTNIKIWNIRQPFTTERWAMKWDGEWHITYEVFRDLGISFAMVLVLIYILVVGWFRDFWTPLVIMSAIPFSLIGILPAHAALGAFFTATSMIGFIAGAGIVVRNSIILVDFIELRLHQGMPLGEAVVDAGAVRFRPMLLTASAVIVGSAVILFDPIFQGLAISLMAGEVASLLLSRMAVPVFYYLMQSWRTRHNSFV
ncbi:MAG: efflux RND transporter permease subunit, partial [Candidatus Fervidibacter sp.]|uniref:efflux RND transporter permease subunit n=1 Tax=Candidatus Fervidibacter sp. TaxID=3100871 RepID=UPI0040499529